jgi:hypothetical protein
VTVTSCDAGAVRAPDAKKLEAALMLVSGRNNLLTTFLGDDIPPAISECVSRDLVRTPLFVSTLTRSAGFTPAEQEQAQTATQRLLRQCAAEDDSS